jgi:MerR family transcriptional regulator/heat shock protein HspR
LYIRIEILNTMHTIKDLDTEANRPILTLSITSQLSGIPAHSIRQYIDRGLLIPYKLDSSRHLFSQNDINRLKNINILINERGLNIAGIKAILAMVPCWAIHKCPEQNKQNCGAYNVDFVPCWEASEKGRVCKNENCRDCEVYTCLSNSIELKSVIRKRIYS